MLVVGNVAMSPSTVVAAEMATAETDNDLLVTGRDARAGDPKLAGALFRFRETCCFITSSYPILTLYSCQYLDCDKKNRG